MTIAAAFWPRRLDEGHFPVEAKLYQTEPETGVRVLVQSQVPEASAAREVVLVHGLEGSGDSGYMRSLAQECLEAGMAVHRLNLRGCGGTEYVAPTLYHAGLTTDLFALLAELDRQRRTPVFLVGFSLGGNIVLKMAGELGADADRLIAGVCAVSAPIHLEACTQRLAETSNRYLEWWYLRSMKRRVRERHRVMPDRFPIDGLDQVKSVMDFDERFTAPHFGFTGAIHYYRTQSAIKFVDRIRVPTLLIQAKDDPLIPFRIFDHPAISAGRHIELLATERGGHMGYLSRWGKLFWLDQEIVAWMGKTAQQLDRSIVI